LVQKITRGTSKRFEVYITDLWGNPQYPDTDTCFVTLIKQGEYGYDSPKGPYACSEGAPGYMYADVALSDSMTLGNWVAHFNWLRESDEDAAYFDFIVVDKIRPYISRYGPGIKPNVEVVG